MCSNVIEWLLPTTNEQRITPFMTDLSLFDMLLPLFHIQMKTFQIELMTSLKKTTFSCNPIWKDENKQTEVREKKTIWKDSLQR